MFKRIHFVILAILLLCGCQKDRSLIRNTEKVNDWIYNTMRTNYLWSATMPAKGETNRTLHPENYFKGELIYKGNGDVLDSDRFSSIKYTGNYENYPSLTPSGEYASMSTDHDFGIDVRIASVNEFYCQVLSVVPSSPAWNAGIRRGDCFNKVNGSTITSLYDYQTQTKSESIEIEFFYPENKLIKLSKDDYYNTPVVLDTVYNLTPPTGYLVYNHFSDGSHSRYFNELKNVFGRFREAGIKNLIVDLRYNSGGELRAARKLASLIVPKKYLGEIYLYKERNSSFNQPARFEAERFLKSSEIGNYNADIENLYILTNHLTASASELLIHTLKPFFKESGNQLIIVGQKTYGKNLGGVTIINSRYEWELHPITMRVYDKYKVSGYEEGIYPDLYVDETYSSVQLETKQYIRPIGNFGDIVNEKLLREVMEMAYGEDIYLLKSADSRQHLDINGRNIFIKEKTYTPSEKTEATTFRDRGLNEGYYYE